MKIPNALEEHYCKELQYYRDVLLKQHLQEAWRHLERAHIIAQAYPFEHTQVHWLMLKFGSRIKNIREILGQVSRLLVGGVKSFVGRIPVGNTGGANVPPLKPMKIPEDLQKVFAPFQKKLVNNRSW